MSPQGKSLMAAGLLAGLAHAAANCPNSVSSMVPAPSVAPGYEARLIASGLNSPRGIAFDNDGRLLVVEQERGVTALTFEDAGGPCLSVSNKETVLEDETLNHGIAMDMENNILYVSSSEAVHRYPFDSITSMMDSSVGVILQNMKGEDHSTRTLMLSKKVPGLLVVGRGSVSNVDAEAKDIDTGHSQVKAFNISDGVNNALDFNDDGIMLGWGLRNDVGIAEEPVWGGLYTVENSVDQMHRQGQDVHENNPGEELQFFGYLNDTTGMNMGTNFGYPECYSAWQPEDLPDNSNIQVGTQFAIDDSGVNDSVCQDNRTQSRLVFQAHTAPLDIKFTTNGASAWITLHGSWNRDNPAGYKLGRVAFANGEPVEPLTSKTAFIDIVSNVDNSQCPDNCFRPVAMAWDKMGRLYFSSDETGEIYVVTAADGKGIDETDASITTTEPGSSGSAPSGSPPSSSGSAPPAASTTGSAAKQAFECVQWLLPAAVAVAAFLV